MDKYKKAGYTAYKLNKSKKSNPFPANSKSWSAWKKGWDEAAEEERRG